MPHLLAQEVTDLKLVATLLDDAVDGEMGVYCAHLVLEALEYEACSDLRPLFAK